MTLLLWAYMFAVQIGMLNLLIAIMTDTYFKVAQGSSLSAWRMSRVARRPTRRVGSSTVNSPMLASAPFEQQVGRAFEQQRRELLVRVRARAVLALFLWY